MNQVQELVVVTPGREGEAVKRLEGLLGMMALRPGFRDASVGRGIEDPSRILVLHCWQRLEDWHAYQVSKEKQDFIAGRPPALYEFQVVGMNWQLDVDSGSTQGAAALRRTVYKEGTAPTHGIVVASRTGRYVDAEPQFEGATLQLSYYDSVQSYRTNRVPVGRRARAYLADEGYELVASSLAEPGVVAAQAR
jgi:heme-degrading monooxygenase HmoA